MIYRNRLSPPPSYENSSLRKNQEVEIEKWRNSLIESTRGGARVKRARYSLALPIRHKAVPNFITELLASFDHKCPFCESKLDIDKTEVCFYRPPYGALKEADGQPDEHYYCWLIWRWSNLFPACESCTNRKGMLFPVAGERANLGVRADHILKKEGPLLLDPCNDNPDEYLEFHEDGTITAKPGSERGAKTIDALNLNRERLQADRKAEAQVLKKAMEAESQKTGASAREVSEVLWQAYCLDDQPFAGMKRQLLKRWIENFGGKDKETFLLEGPAKGEPQGTIGPDVTKPISGNQLLRIFLCHASADKPAVRDLYRRLVADGFDVWLAEEKIMPGQDWDLEIRKAVRNSDTVVVCLSHGSITKEGYIQKEMRFALEIAEEKPEGTIFLIPVRLEDCDVPDRLSRWQWVNLPEERGYARLLQALRKRAEDKGFS